VNEQTIRVLVVEDTPGDNHLLMQQMLGQATPVPLELEFAGSLSRGLERLTEGETDVVLLDLSLPDSQGLDTFVKLHAQVPRVPIIVLTSFDDEALAARAVRKGAQDYLVKGRVDGNLLARAIRYAIERKRAEETLQRYADEQAALYTVTSVAANLLERDELLSATLDAVVSLMDSDAGWVTLPGPTLDEPPSVAVWRGVSKSFVEAEESIPLSTCPVCTQLLAGNDAQTEPVLIAECPRLPPDTLANMNLHSHVGIPMSAGDRVLGIMHVAWRAQHAYSETDRALLRTIGQHIGLALHNSQLYQAARQVDRMRVLNELERVLAATLDPDEVIEIALHQITAALNTPLGVLFVLPSDGVALSPSRGSGPASLSRGPSRGGPAQCSSVEEAGDGGNSAAPLLPCEPSSTRELRSRVNPRSRGRSSHLYGKGDARSVKLFTLTQGQTELTGSRRDMEHVAAFLQRMEDCQETTSFPSDELAMIGGHDELARLWGPNGLAVPLRSEGHLIAVLAVGGRPVDQPFVDEDRALAQAAANRVGQAIQNARLYQASQQQSARLATLNAIATASVASLELDTVLHRILELTCQELNAAEGSIFLSEPDTGELFFAVTLPDSSSAKRRQHLAPGQGIVGWVAQHGQSVRVNDVRRDPRFYDGVDAVTGFETHSLLCAPLRHLGEITGAIAIVNKHEGEFTEDDLGLLEAVSSIAAVALENARLYTATRRRADELARLNEIGIALTSTLNDSLVVHAALNQARRLFGADRVSLLQLDPQTDELCFVQSLIEGEPVDIPLRLAAGEGIAAWALAQRLPVLIEDAQEDSHFSDRIDRHLGTRTRTVMAVPLLTREHATGVLEIISYQADAYTSDNLHTLQAIASMLTAALENAGLYSELKALLREREETQTQLIHSEKMAALGRLVASIAHEINNPLQAVQGCLTLAQDVLGPSPHQDKLERYLDVAGNEIERIAAIVRRMRDFYRPAREGMSSTDVHAVLESVLELTNKQLQHSDVVVERTWAEELPQVWGNSDHLRQVFLNLVLNAIDAMPTGGVLRVSTAQARMESDDGQPPQPAVRVEFSDTGDGMPPETQSRVFEPFFTTKEGGTGLGLSISYGIIQAHRGEITVTSQVGEGTTFTLLLPAERPDM